MEPDYDANENLRRAQQKQRSIEELFTIVKKKAQSIIVRDDLNEETNVYVIRIRGSY